ncbi:hypothetical protein BASA82_001068 [Batrachochytrium salamandrivorans]|nr:hypothetical protein BASA81_004903 [Batrachochytrium salamandrivorans]KAH9260903.1 hypothetical protein BASA82_001068 [Batrachochytrium salamandrivorans]
MRLPPPRNTKPQPQEQSATAATTTTTALATETRFSSALVQSQASDLIPRGSSFAMQRSELESTTNVQDQTTTSMQVIVDKKAQATNQLASLLDKALPQNHTSKFIKINSEMNAFTGRETKERIVRLVEKAVDPLEPAKFKFRAVPKGPGSPPVPLLHSPTKKATEEERANWNIPTAVSNWNNTKGFIVSLDKRLAQTQANNDGPVVNDKFAKLADSLFTAEDVSRTMVEQRFIQRQENEERKLQDENEKLRLAALEARAMRQAKPSGMMNSGGNPVDRTDRDLVRHELRRELDRESKLALLGRKTRQERDEERDISELVALGRPVPSKGEEFDQRLFSKAGESGLGNDLSRMGDEEDNIYSTSLFKPQADSYRPSQSVLNGSKSGEELSKKLDELKKTSKFAPSGGGGPVLFEKQEDAFLSSMQATKGKAAIEGLGGNRQAFGLAAGRFASDKPQSQQHRRFEDKDDERELAEEHAMQQQAKRDAKKAKITFQPASQ